jgi:type I restriction modification DNA specificity domain protein (fragment)
MAEWIECKISDIGTVVGGATPSTKKPENYGNGTIAWITPKDLSTFSGRYIQHGERNITEAGLKSCSTQLLPKDAVLFSSRAPIGYVAIAANDVCTNQGFKSVIPNENINPLFLYYLLKYNKDKIEVMGSGTTFKEVSGNTMKNIVVSVPTDKKVQERISSMLGSIDNKIEENERINNNLEQQVQALFRNQFLTQETLPDGWIKVTLGEISLMGAGGDKPKTVSATQTENCPYPIYSNGISDEGLYGFTNEYKIKDESITVSARGTIGFVCLRHKSYTPIVRLVTLIPNTDVLSAKYLYLWLKNSPIHGTGTTQQQLTVPDFRKTEIILPTKEEMSSFTDTVTPLFEAMWANQDENTKLSKVRDSLLPKLMSGELDVSDIEL